MSSIHLVAVCLVAVVSGSAQIGTFDTNYGSVVGVWRKLSAVPLMVNWRGRRLTVDESLLTNALTNRWTPQSALESVRRSEICASVDGKQQVKDVLNQLLASAGDVVLPSLDGPVDAMWACLCTDLDLSAQSYADLVNANTTHPIIVDPFLDAITQILPSFFGASGVCGSSCRNGAVALADWAIQAADALFNAHGVYRSGLLGLPEQVAACVCDGFSWRSLVHVFDETELRVVVQTLVDALFNGAPLPDALTSQTFRDAFVTLYKFPEMLTSADGGCSKTGCQGAALQIMTFAKTIGTSLLEYYQHDGHVAVDLVKAAKALLPSTVMDCVCGGTLSWMPAMEGISEALFGLRQLGASIKPFAASVLSAIFSPHFLCSSDTCQELTDQVMAIANATSATSESLRDPLAFGALEWCPDESAGVAIKQTFVLEGTLEDFGTSKRAAFVRGLVDEVNFHAMTDATGGDFLRITVAQVRLLVSAGSVNVVATIDVASPALTRAVETTMNGLALAAVSSPSTLESKLGVAVTSVTPPSSDNIDKRVGSTGGGGGSAPEATAFIAGIGVGAFVVVAALGLAIACAVRRSRPRAATKVANSTRYPTQNPVNPRATDVPTSPRTPLRTWYAQNESANVKVQVHTCNTTI